MTMGLTIKTQQDSECTKALRSRATQVRFRFLQGRHFLLSKVRLQLKLTLYVVVHVILS